MMKKTILLGAALLVGITSAQANWWDDENSYYNRRSNQSQVYTQKDEQLALERAIKASLQDMGTKTSQASPEVKSSAATRTRGVRKANRVGAQTWMHNTFQGQGPNDAYALVRTQRQLAKTYSSYGIQSGQKTLRNDGALSEDHLLQFALQLSLLDR